MQSVFNFSYKILEKKSQCFKMDHKIDIFQLHLPLRYLGIRDFLGSQEVQSAISIQSLQRCHKSRLYWLVDKYCSSNSSSCEDNKGVCCIWAHGGRVWGRGASILIAIVVGARRGQKSDCEGGMWFFVSGIKTSTILI